MKQVFRSLLNIFHNARNSGVIISAVLLNLIPTNAHSQEDCNYPPEVSLSESSGTICYSSQLTLGGNTFGGSATAVIITENGRGSIVPSAATSSPFSFTYLPANNDAGRLVTITVTTNNPEGAPCEAARATYLLSVTSVYPAPIIGSIIQPTCTSSTGSVELSGLPSSPDWTITVNPGGMTQQGSGTTATVTDLPAGSYTFTVSVSSDCSSPPSQQVVITEQPMAPPPPLPTSITTPTCTIPTGSITLAGLPPGTWTLTRYPGTISSTGTGTTTIVSDLYPGIYNFSVVSGDGCSSLISEDATIPYQPPVPDPPSIGTIVQPTLLLSTGSVTLTGLPVPGTWTIIRSPGGVSTTGSGSAFTINGLEPGTYTFRVRNNSGCSSVESAPVLIRVPAPPELVITDPEPVCFPATVDLTVPAIKEGSPAGLTYTYWTDDLATLAMETPASAADGIYYIKGTAASGLFDIEPVIVIVRQYPVSNAGSDQVLPVQFSTILNAHLEEGESGRWTTDSADISFNDLTDPNSAISGLHSGNNVLSWIVNNGVCPADTDNVVITVGDIIVPTLITPNGDSWNEYFIINGLENLGRSEFTVFDRRGYQVFQDSDYDNKWNGVDYNDKPLINDTYFYVLKSVGGRSYNGYIVIRR
jgi:gliding motility-associated-like protein